MADGELSDAIGGSEGAAADVIEPREEPISPPDESATVAVAASENGLRLWAQIAAVVVLTLPYYSLFDLLFAGRLIERLPYTFWGDWSHMMLHDAFLGACLLAVVCWSREPWSAFGFKGRGWSIDIVTGFLAYWCAVTIALVGQDLIESLLFELQGESFQPLEYRYWGEPPRGMLGLAAVFALAISTGFTEELAMRGILMTRLERVLRSKALGVLFSAAYFGAYHVSGGIAHVGPTFLVGLVFGVFFVWTRRLRALVIAHAFYDFQVFLQLAG